VIDSGDALVYTDEEKARAKQLMIETKIKALDEFKPFKLAQRVIAFTFLFNFILSFWCAVTLYFFYPDLLNGYVKLVESYSLGWIMLAIVSFYFGGGFLNSIGGKK